MKLAWLSAALLLATGCNQYEIFRIAGFSQESFSNDADILFVVDNSCSMVEEAAGLAEGMHVFLDKLTNPESGGLQTDGLADAVDNYIEFAQNREAYVDYQIGITTHDVAGDYGALIGPLVENSEDDVQGMVLDNLLCDAACLTAPPIPSDPAYVPGEDLDTVSEEFLDDFCGVGAWEADCSSNDEEGLEAVFLALCRATPEADLPQDCIDSMTPEMYETNAGLLRPNSTVIPILITDEGDTSRRIEPASPDIDAYLRLFRKFNHRMTFAVIGPDPDDLGCTELATSQGVQRYANIVDATRGRYFPIASSSGGGCAVTDFDEALEELGELLNALLEEFPLNAVPDPESIIVFVEGDQVDRASENADGTYTDGWEYNADTNSVLFHGTAVPDYEEEVRIYYSPLTGMPRDLPF